MHISIVLRYNPSNMGHETVIFQFIKSWDTTTWDISVFTTREMFIFVTPYNEDYVSVQSLYTQIPN